MCFNVNKKVSIEFSFVALLKILFSKLFKRTKMNVKTVKSEQRERERKCNIKAHVDNLYGENFCL